MVKLKPKQRMPFAYIGSIGQSMSFEAQAQSASVTTL
jgi:hypothetical protein